MSSFACLPILVLCLTGITNASPATPHVVFVFADDLGWNDISYQATDSVAATPYIDALAADGVKLNNYYVQPICSPSRVAFLTGRYPYKIGVLTTFSTSEKACMPFVGLLPETLKTHGYTNHLVGKWHLGFCKTECLPTSRGFDTFSGFYNGAQDYYTHTVAQGYDWKVDNSSGSFTMWDYEGIYGVDLMDSHIQDVISSHDADTPMFLYYAMQAVHSPIDPRESDLSGFSDVEDETRQKYLALVKGMDDSMNVLVTALKDAGMYDDTIIIFSGDNGGNPSEGANNWPLSGQKGSYFEGGIKTAAFVVGSGLGVSNVVSDGLMHAVDWYPTILSAIGQDPVSDLDGVDQWSMISTNGASSRTEIVHNIDTDDTGSRTKGAIRSGDFKLISLSINKHERIAPPESDEISVTDLSTVGVQLYNISADPYETTNLASESDYRVYRKELMTLLTSYLEADDVEPSIHVDRDPDVVNLDDDGAYITGWC